MSEKCAHEPMLVYSDYSEHHLTKNPVCRRCGVPITWLQSQQEYQAMTAHDKTREALADCPECGNSYLAIRADVYKDKREFVYCDVCGATATRPLWQKAALAASAPSQQAGAAAVPAGWKLVRIEMDDEMVRASLAVEWPAIYRDSLGLETDGPTLKALTEARVALARKRHAAVLAAAPSPAPAAAQANPAPHFMSWEAAEQRATQREHQRIERVVATLASIQQEQLAALPSTAEAVGRADHVPVSPEEEAAIDAAVGLFTLPPIRVSHEVARLLNEAAASKGLILQAHVRDLLLDAVGAQQAEMRGLSEADIEAIAHRRCWRYKYSSDPNHSHTYTFNRLCLIDFVRALGITPPPTTTGESEVGQ